MHVVTLALMVVIGVRLMTSDNISIRFNHGFEVFNVGCGPIFALGFNIDRGPHPKLNTENPWLNVIITHSKFISSPFISLFLTKFQYFLNHSPSYIATDTGYSVIEMNTYSCLSGMSFEINGYEFRSSCRKTNITSVQCCKFSWFLSFGIYFNLSKVRS